jgi:hypothetical protein
MVELAASWKPKTLLTSSPISSHSNYRSCLLFHWIPVLLQRLLLCALDQCLVRSGNEHFRFRKDGYQKVLLRAILGTKLVYRVHGRIDIPPESFLSSLYRRDHITEGRFTNHQQIDVAGGVEFTPRGRAEYERRMHAVCERHQRLTQNVHKSGGLGE